jgi:hypothetical protein
MVRRIRPPGAAGRTGLAAISVGALIALAACGSESAGGHSGSAGAPVPGGKASAGVALCRDIPRLTTVVASPAMTLRETQPGQLLPRSITVRQPLAVRGLATTLCGLPRAPRGPISCPAQFGGSLRLAFAAGGRRFPPVTILTSGCRVVTGLGPVRRVPSLAFWRTLGKDLGFKVPQGTASQDGGINP